MLEPNKNYVIDIYGNIHEMRFVGDCDWEENAVTSIKEIRTKAIDNLCEAFRKDWEEQCENDMEDCINWYDWLIASAKQMKGGAIDG